MHSISLSKALQGDRFSSSFPNFRFRWTPIRPAGPPRRLSVRSGTGNHERSDIRPTGNADGNGYRSRTAARRAEENDRMTFAEGQGCR